MGDDARREELLEPKFVQRTGLVWLLRTNAISRDGRGGPAHSPAESVGPYLAIPEICLRREAGDPGIGRLGMTGCVCLLVVTLRAGRGYTGGPPCKARATNPQSADGVVHWHWMAWHSRSEVWVSVCVVRNKKSLPGEGDVCRVDTVALGEPAGLARVCRTEIRMQWCPRGKEANSGTEPFPPRVPACKLTALGCYGGKALTSV